MMSLIMILIMLMNLVTVITSRVWERKKQYCNGKLGSILIIALQIIRMIWGITMLMILGLSKNEHGAPLKMEQNFC